MWSRYIDHILPGMNEQYLYLETGQGKSLLPQSVTTSSSGQLAHGGEETGLLLYVGPSFQLNKKEH